MSKLIIKAFTVEDGGKWYDCNVQLSYLSEEELHGLCKDAHYSAIKVSDGRIFDCGKGFRKGCSENVELKTFDQCLSEVVQDFKDFSNKYKAVGVKMSTLFKLLDL